MNASSHNGRAILLVLDSVGIGELPDAADFGDVGSHTLGHIAQACEGFAMPHMRQLGLGNIPGFPQMPPVKAPGASWGKMIEVSQGKDTTSGHWEFVGLTMETPFRTFPQGFGQDILGPFCQKIGVDGVLGNIAASGTVIIQDLGREHIKTGKPIVYTSADPVFQIAAHEDVVPLHTLYAWCEAAYDIVIPQGLSRVIARPFVGQYPEFVRTSNRKDFALAPPGPTVLGALTKADIPVTGVGKISDIYAGQGITSSHKTKDNAHGMATTLTFIQDPAHAGLIFTNLVDFDSLFGHRRDPEGYAQALMDFDAWVPAFLDALRPHDLFIITADHGNDPTYKGTDHTREYVPLIAGIKGSSSTPRDLGVRSTFADVGATIADHFGVHWPQGTSFLHAL